MKNRRNSRCACFCLHYFNSHFNAYNRFECDPSPSACAAKWCVRMKREKKKTAQHSINCFGMFSIYSRRLPILVVNIWNPLKNIFRWRSRWIENWNWVCHSMKLRTTHSSCGINWRQKKQKFNSKILFHTCFVLSSCRVTVSHIHTHTWIRND